MVDPLSKSDWGYRSPPMEFVDPLAPSPGPAPGASSPHSYSRRSNPEGRSQPAVRTPGHYAQYPQVAAYSGYSYYYKNVAMPWYQPTMEGQSYGRHSMRQPLMGVQPYSRQHSMAALQAMPPSYYPHQSTLPLPLGPSQRQPQGPPQSWEPPGYPGYPFQQAPVREAPLARPPQGPPLVPHQSALQRRPLAPLQGTPQVPPQPQPLLPTADGATSPLPSPRPSPSRSPGGFEENSCPAVADLAVQPAVQPEEPAHFMCEVCGLMVPRGKGKVIARNLKHHKAVYHGPKPFACHACPKTFPVKSSLELHLKKHLQTKDYACDACPFKSNYKSVWKTHQRRHLSDFSFSCDQCGRRFVLKSELQNHKLTHEGKPRSERKCRHCKQMVSGERALVEHIQEQHPDKMELYCCGECDNKYPTLYLRRQHQRAEHRANFPRKRHLCDECGKEVTSLTSLAAHKRRHKGEKPFKCSYCESRFCTKSILRLHEGTQHRGERKHHCDVCGKTFTQRSSYKIHHRLHTGERPYPCHLCEAAFVSKSPLNTHLKNHK